jgi:hypothetical protein
MKWYTVVEILFVGFLICLLIGVGVWVYLLKKPTTGINCHTHTHWMWADNCLSFQEKFHDSSLKSPSSLQPYLVDFSYAEGAGEAIYLPLWYRFRYVNVNTGGYSDFSSWTTTPVIAGSCSLPCYSSSSECLKRGFETCTYNQPTVGVAKKDIQYTPETPLPNGDFVYINLHRYVGSSASDSTPPSDDVHDEIVGYLGVDQNINGETFYTWVDVLNNPCKTRSCQIPSWCRSSSECKK